MFIEDRLGQMQDRLKVVNYQEEGQRIVELCEDWWELLRQETILFEVYVSLVIVLNTFRKSSRTKPLRKP